jgi:short-subunit dehydrogenase
MPSPPFRHVLLTGASSGLGRALALQFAGENRVLSLIGRDAARLDAVAADCRAQGAAVRTALIDVTDRATLFDWLVARDREMAVDLLIANAGLGGAAALAPRSGEDGDQAHALFNVNTLGLVNTLTPLLPAMRARGSGQLVLVGSIQGDLGLPQSPVYSASKAAVRIYGDGLRRLLRADGVGVTTVLPGFIDTPMSQSLQMVRPFLWTPERAAARIARDVARGRPYSVFPWPLRLAVGLGRWMPPRLTDAVLSASLRFNRWPDDAGGSKGQ